MTTITIFRAGLLAAVTLGAAVCTLAPTAAVAQQTSAQTGTARAAGIKAGKGEKVCRVRLQYSGQVRTWLCPKEVPCCVWHEINYVKCGSTITGCL